MDLQERRDTEGPEFSQCILGEVDCNPVVGKIILKSSGVTLLPLLGKETSYF
jgi:hypothetical protein